MELLGGFISFLLLLIVVYKSVAYWFGVIEADSPSYDYDEIDEDTENYINRPGGYHH